MKINYKQGTLEDIECWQHLRKKLWQDCTDEDHLREIKRDLGDDGKICIIAFSSDRAIGFIELSTRSIVDGCESSPVAYVEGWYVDSDYQKKGVGKGLLQKAEDWARDKGYSEIGSDSEIINELSIKVHKKLGFEELDRVVQFKKNL